MAFCPNCGTPNTDQAEKCVSCGFELAPKQKAKFKGTIMMSGVQAPAKPPVATPQAALPAAASPAPVAPAPAAQPAAAGRNLAFEKTMMGPMAGLPPQPVAPSAASAPAAVSTNTVQDLSRAATLEGPAPQFTAPAQAASAPQFSAPAAPVAAPAPARFDTTGNAGGFANAGGFDDEVPALPKPNTNKVLAIGCAVVLAMTVLVGILLFVVAKNRVKGLFGSGQDDAATEAWRGTLSEALSQVSALCQTNCAAAANFFHPSVQTSLMTQAKALNAASLQKLADPNQSQARMLNATEDGTIATNLGLDPQLCVRIVTGNAKVVGCSVPNPGGQADMRIVHMSGFDAP